MRALEQALVLQVGDVFVDGRMRAELQAGGDLLIGRRVAVLGGEIREEVDNFFLPPRNGHGDILANKQRTASEM